MRAESERVEEHPLRERPDPRASASGLRKRIGLAASVFAGFFVLFAVLRTQNIFAIEGGNRCFEIYRRPILYFDVNNHLLQPAYVLAWTRLAAWLGNKPTGPLQFFQLVSLMNCLAMAASLAIVFSLMYVVVPRWRLALAVTVGYGFAKAFLLQATNANEPPMGLLWSLLAILFAVLCFRIKSNWPVMASAALLALAMATYETMILLFPAALYLIWQSRAGNRGNDAAAPVPRPARPASSAQIQAFVTFAISGAAVTGLIFGYAYSGMGLHGTGAMVRRFLLHEDTQAYMGVGVGKMLNLPVGFVRNLFPVVPTYSGLRALLHGPRGSLVLFFSAGVLGGACVPMCAYSIWKNQGTFSAKERIALSAAAIGLAASAAPLVIWDPGYPKFWLQPLACVAFLVMMTLRRTPEESVARQRLRGVLATALLIGLLSNSAWAIRDHIHANPDLPQAREIAQIVGPNDFVVGSWYGPAILYGAIFASENRFMDFPEDAVFHHQLVTSELNEAVGATAKRGGRVYFIGILDQNETEWDKFLGMRCGIPYSALRLYRERSTIVQNFGSGPAKVAMFRFDPTAMQ